MDDGGIARRQLTPLEPVVAQIESAEVLDGPAKMAGRNIRNALSSRKLKELVSGTWLGHAVHPMLTDVVIGTFMSASLLDLIGGDAASPAGERLIGVGILAYVPTAVTGANDWADTEIADERVRRVGLVHATTNAAALSLYVASLRRRRQGARGQGALLSAAGATVLMAAGYLGGHLSLTRAVGPDQTTFDRGFSDWTPAGDPGQLTEGSPTRVVVQDTPVLLLRSGEQIYAIHDRCSHRGCSLSEGEIEDSEVVCACHGSRFDLRDGSLRGGPATSPQPAFEVRQRDGSIEIRLQASAAD
jgi:nitrite reductase/ring-hydroxylating ferredoxin subunit/uncharacterized membrane protein